MTKTIISKISITQRNAFKIIGIASSYNLGGVYITKTSLHRQANAKSLLGIMSLSVIPGDEIEISISTSDIHNIDVLIVLGNLINVFSGACVC